MEIRIFKAKSGKRIEFNKGRKAYLLPNMMLLEPDKDFPKHISYTIPG